MIYQPRNVQPSGVSIDGLLDNTFTMEIQTNSYVSAYQLLIVDFDNNEVYTGAKTTLAKYAYNGDTLEIPVSASAVALSNGTNYKWRVRLYQPTADMLITYGLVQATSTTTTIYLQPNINIKAGMAITINSQTKTISSYNSDTGMAVVISAFSSAPAVGTQYKIYSDFIETVPDYIVYARQTPAVAISNVPSSLTLKYHTFQGTYTQSDNVPIVYHKFDLYTKNDDGTISLVASSDKVYSANLSYTYDSFRTGNKYLIQMTVENDMGIISTTDMYEFNVLYDIVEYLQQPLASFDDKNNAVKVSWVTPVENEATSFRSDAATGIIQDNNNTLTRATFEPGQSIGEGDVVQITNSDCELVIDGKSTQATSTQSANLCPPFTDSRWVFTNGASVTSEGYLSIPATTGARAVINIPWNKSRTCYFKDIIVSGGNAHYSGEYFNESGTLLSSNGKVIVDKGANYQDETLWGGNNQYGDALIQTTNIKFTIQFSNYTPNPYVIKDLIISENDINYIPFTPNMPSPDYPSEIESVKGKNLFDDNFRDYTRPLDYFIHPITLEQGQSYTLKATLTGTKMSGVVVAVAPYGDRYSDFSAKLRTVINTTGNAYSILLTIDDTWTSPKLVIYANNEETFNNIFKNYEIQLEKGSTATDYVPYDTVQVKSVGKNLIPNNWKLVDANYTKEYGKLIISGNLSTTYLYGGSTNFIDLTLKPGTYTFSASSNTFSNIYAVVNNNGIIENWNNGITKTFTSDVVIQSIRCNETTLNIGTYLWIAQIEKGTQATTYEPYQENTLNIDLQGNELCSLPNNIKDELVIENGRAKIIKRIGKVVLDGSENWQGYKNLGNNVRAYITKSNILRQSNGYSNYFQIKTSLSNYAIDETSIMLRPYTDSIIVIKIPTSELNTIDIAGIKNWLSTHNTQVDYELAEPQIIELGDGVVPYIDGINYMHISSNMDTTFSLVYPHKTISGNAYDYTEFNPPGVKQTGAIKSYNAITGIGTLMPQYPFMYTPMQGDSYAVISNIYNVSGFSYLYNTPYNTVNSLYTHGYTATWATPDGLCVLPDDFNITLQFSPDGNFFYDQNGVYQEVVNLITTETDDANNEGEFTIKIDKNKLIFVQNPDISLELPFYTNTTQVFVLSSASVAQINNDYVWDDTATWTDTYTWVEGGTSLERVCNHWWKVQITNTGIKIEEIFPTT